MNETEYLARITHQILEQNKPLVIASIISHSGSTPRHNGTQMAVDSDGKFYGTIGGSLLEATAIKQSVAAIATHASQVMDFHLDNKGVHSTGMICGGKAEVLLDYIAPTPENKQFFKTWLDTVVHGTRFYFMTTLIGSKESLQKVGHCLWMPNGEIIGSSLLEKSEIDYIKSELHNVSFTTLMSLEKSEVLICPTSKIITLYCLGAGHVAKPTAHLAALVGFRVVVIDDRAEFSNQERFPEAAEVRVIEEFNNAFDPAGVDKDSFIAIFTRGHQFDRFVLEQSLKTQAGYIGLMGSKKKRNSIYEHLLQNGYTQKDIDRIHSPIGLPLEAETPEELAVSIVGELINERARLQK